MTHKLKATLIALVCQGEMMLWEELSWDSEDCIEQAADRLWHMFHHKQKSILCSEAPAALQTAEIFERKFKRRATVYPGLFMNDDFEEQKKAVDYVSFKVDPEMGHIIIVPGFIIGRFVNLYAMTNYDKFLKITKEPLPGDLFILDDTDGGLQEYYFTPRQNAKV